MKFSEIYGQDTVKTNLLNSVKENRISHAQLYTGDAGIGKLQLAIAYAQFINCTNKQEHDSCGTCPSCLKIEKLIHPDVHYIFPVIKIDSKEKTSDDFIGAWREMCLDNKFFSLSQWLQKINAEKKQGSILTSENNSLSKKINLKSFESDYKIFIIWQADKMNSTFANKVLKILEEPPKNTLLLLISEKPELLLPTIISRTQILKIPKLPEKILTEGLIDLLNIDINKAQNLARISDGNFINAFEITNNNDTLEFNKEIFKQFMRTCWAQKPIDINQFVESISTKGREQQKGFLNYSLRMVRENLILNLGENDINQMSDDELEFSKNFAKYIHSKNAGLIANEIGKAHYHIERNGYARIIFFDLSLKLGKLLKL